jgi:HD superfamily phosphohydrolase
MDTPEFQRLRRVKQLGMAHYAYPSAVHTRFEHSLGVMHMAGRMIDQLRHFTPISDRTKDLVQLAGMYHDIGHFAYSHLFDAFLSKLPHETLTKIPAIFQHTDHEHRSVYFLRSVNARLNLLTSEEEDFVVNVIVGKVADESQAFLYEIVCNRDCGIDVDRMDFLRRDSYHTALPGFQSDYILACAAIGPDNHIAFKEKARGDLIDLLKTRKRMFDNVYQHHTAVKMDKIHYCMMKRLGADLFQFGDSTDDYNIESLFRRTESTRDLIRHVDERDLDHSCDVCREYRLVKSYKQAKTIDTVRFLAKMPQIFSREKVAKHNTEDDLWIIYGKKVLDVSTFKHPGGKDALLKYAGAECTANIFAVQAHHVNVDLFTHLIDQYTIGVVQ